ncbi:hypothetical protein EXIGLDRAFT_48469 [Exidia glandulosa HHB12029]|uniref:Uncharacterized protein n=1 Tax=Exidia glandulosa HHB12029 TaxID=1314781 RepID=A0A165P737_EXIGL|nr:hypothetical protein EXIGLDRAFT_48469 [Exidia glandulosa HHB12029]
MVSEPDVSGVRTSHRAVIVDATTMRDYEGPFAPVFPPPVNSKCKERACYEADRRDRDDRDEAGDEPETSPWTFTATSHRALQSRSSRMKPLGSLAFFCNVFEVCSPCFVQRRASSSSSPSKSSEEWGLSTARTTLATWTVARGASGSAPTATRARPGRAVWES